MKLKFAESENNLKLSTTILMLTLITLLIPTIGFDIYAHTSSWSSPESYRNLTNLVVFDVEVPRYLLFGPFLTLTTLYGFLPGILPFFLVVYFIINKTFMALGEIKKSELGILTIVFITYNLVFISTSSISIIFIYLWFITKKKDSKLFFFGTFSSPIGLMLGTIIILFLFFYLPNIKNLIIYYSLLILITLLVAKLYPLSDYDPMRNINIDTFYSARQFKIPKETEFFMLLTSSSFIFILLKIKTFSIKKVNYLLQRLFASLLIIFFLYSNFKVLISTQKTQTFFTYFSQKLISNFKNTNYNEKKFLEVHNRVFCTAYISNRLCEEIFFKDKTDSVQSSRGEFIY